MILEYNEYVLLIYNDINPIVRIRHKKIFKTKKLNLIEYFF